MSRAKRLPLPLLLLTLLVQDALSADLDRLARFLTPALMAHQFTAVCQARDTQFELEIGGLSTINIFVERVRDSVLSKLTPDQAREVLIAAATAARDVALIEIRSLSSPSKEEEIRRYQEWCSVSVPHFIKNLIERHDRDKNFIMEAIARAKK